MKRLFQRAIKDFRENQFLTLITVITIALSILIASSFALFFINAGEALDRWQSGLRMMVYLEAEASQTAQVDTQARLQALPGVRQAVYIPKNEAMQRLKQQMQNHSALLENLRRNPLPDAFELTLDPAMHTSEALLELAGRIKALAGIAEVEYGKQWIQRFTGVVNLFSLAGYAIGALFFMATIFIVANTIRLVLYSRRDEIEIMRLVGATDRFIRLPFYLQGMMQGGAGTLIGLAVLFLGYFSLSSHFAPDLSGGMVSVRFFSAGACAAIVLAGVLIGWLGCWISLKQFLKS
jgi:cell division transport system permease protein